MLVSLVPMHEIAAAIPAARDGVVLEIDRHSHIYLPTAADAREFC
jgi:hypothetical protein